MSSRSRKRKRTHRTGETGASGTETKAIGDPLETPVTDIGMTGTPVDSDRQEPDATAALKVKITATADVGTTALSVIATAHLLFAGELGALPTPDAILEVIESILVGIEHSP